jgi:hypothetical protein
MTKRTVWRSVHRPGGDISPGDPRAARLWNRRPTSTSGATVYVCAGMRVARKRAVAGSAHLADGPPARGRRDAPATTDLGRESEAYGGFLDPVPARKLKPVIEGRPPVVRAPRHIGRGGGLCNTRMMARGHRTQPAVAKWGGLWSHDGRKSPHLARRRELGWVVALLGRGPARGASLIHVARAVSTAFPTAAEATSVQQCRRPAP